MTPSTTICLRLSPEERAPARARHAVLEAIGVQREREWSDTAALIVSELVTNALVHGAPHGADQIVLQFELAAQSMRVEVRDPGRGPGGPRVGPEQNLAGGYGLVLVERLADRWGHSSDPGGTVVWAELDAPA